MKEQQNFILKDITTFKIGGPAKRFVEVTDIEEIQQVLAVEQDVDVLVLGGGSNVLISDQGYAGTVMRLSNKGISIASETDTEATLSVASGEFWDDVVKFAVLNNLWGIENLSYIPGDAGGFAVQNVGAYGQEASQVVEYVEALNLQSGQIENISNADCKFAYRKSIFNTEQKGKYVILNTLLKLSKVPKPNLTYADLQKKFSGAAPKLEEIRQAIIDIRSAKYPYPYGKDGIGSAGSFFKNCLLSEAEYSELEEQFKKNIPEKIEQLQAVKNKFPSEQGIKIPTAFLLEACGLKGMQSGGARINEKQPLIILNETGSASAKDVLSLVKRVRDAVEQKTGLHLLTEPELIGFSAEELKEFGFNEEEAQRYTR